MAEPTTIDATIDAYLAAFGADDRAAYLACFAAEAWIEDPVGSPRRQGVDDIGAFWDETHALPDALELRAGDIRVVVGQEAAFTFQARPTVGGQTYVLDIIDHLTFDDTGKITSLRAFFDPGSMRPAAD